MTGTPHLRASDLPAEQLRQALTKMGLSAKTKVISKEKSKGKTKKPDSHRNDVKLIIESLKAADITCRCGTKPDGYSWFSLYCEGARGLTLNRLIAVLQYRKYETFALKTLWRQRIADAVLELKSQYGELPCFTRDATLWVYRRSERLVDGDSLEVVFKYAVDSLKRSGIITDDNPNVITRHVPLQEKGPPALALRLEGGKPREIRLPQRKDWHQAKSFDCFHN